MLRKTRVVGALIVSLAIAGCGGPSGLSKAELIKQADAICKRHHGKISAGTNLIPEYTAQIGELRGLKARHGRGLKRYTRWLAASDAARVKLMRDPALITNGASFATVNGEADGLGLSRQCHVGPS